MHVMQRLLISHRVDLLFAPYFDQTLVPGCWVTGGDASDDRLVQLRKHIFKTQVLYVNNAYFVIFLL